MDKAIDLGITLFDTADMYGNRGGSETQLGEVLGNRRQDIVLATKFGLAMGDGAYNRGASRRYIFKAVEASLKRLKTDYIDLYQIHFPDAETPIEETLSALDDLVRAGKVRYIGCSNFSGWQLVESHWVSKTQNLTPFISAQNHYNLLTRNIEFDLIPAAQKYDVGLLPFFPLASGALTGKYARNQAMPEDGRLTARKEMAGNILTDENFDRIDKMTAFADEHGHSLLELAFSWLASQDVVGSVIAGATTPAQVEANAAAADWKLTREEIDHVGMITM